MIVLSKVKEGEGRQPEEYFTYFEDCLSSLTLRLGKKGRLSTAFFGEVTICSFFSF